MRLLVQSTSTLARASRRYIATSSIARKDFVQDLYIRELKAYKPAPTAKDAHVGAVREFTTLKPPSPPSLPSDLASELSAYDTSEPVLAAKAVDTGAQVSSEGKLGGPALLKFLQEDLPADDHHHH